MKNLRWRDIKPAKDREGRKSVVLFVQGKSSWLFPGASEMISSASAISRTLRNPSRSVSGVKRTRILTTTGWGCCTKTATPLMPIHHRITNNAATLEEHEPRIAQC